MLVEITKINEYYEILFKIYKVCVTICLQFD